MKGNYLRRKLNAPAAPIIELIRALIEVNLSTRMNQLLRSILSRYCARESTVFSTACHETLYQSNSLLKHILIQFQCLSNTTLVAGTSLQAIRADLRGERRLQDATARKERHRQN